MKSELGKGSLKPLLSLTHSMAFALSHGYSILQHRPHPRYIELQEMAVNGVVEEVQERLSHVPMCSTRFNLYVVLTVFQFINNMLDTCRS